MLKDKFDIIILSTGTIASTILVMNYLNLKNLKVRFYNNPMMQLCFYKPNLYLEKSQNINFSHPLKNFHQKIRTFQNKGSLIPLKFFENYYLGFSNKNNFINFIKKGMIAGNVFFDSKLSKNFIEIKNNKNLINFNNDINKLGFLKNTKKKLKEMFNKLNFFSVPFMNFKTYVSGSDAHYSSSLYEFKYKNKKIINKNCELEKSKNFYVLDGSVIPRGTFYPSFLISLNAFYQAKKISKKC